MCARHVASNTTDTGTRFTAECEEGADLAHVGEPARTGARRRQPAQPHGCNGTPTRTRTHANRPSPRHRAGPCLHIAPLRLSPAQWDAAQPRAARREVAVWELLHDCKSGSRCFSFFLPKFGRKGNLLGHDRRAGHGRRCFLGGRSLWPSLLGASRAWRGCSSTHTRAWPPCPRLGSRSAWVRGRSLQLRRCVWLRAHATRVRT